MSANFPNRQKWLDVRATPRRDTRPLRFAHISTDYRWVIDPKSPHGPAHFIKCDRGTKYVRPYDADYIVPARQQRA